MSAVADDGASSLARVRLQSLAAELALKLYSILSFVCNCYRKPEEYGKKLPMRSAYAGKHLSTVPPKDGRTVDVYFEKKHNWISAVGGGLLAKALGCMGHMYAFKLPCQSMKPSDTTLLFFFRSLGVE